MLALKLSLEQLQEKLRKHHKSNSTFLRPLFLDNHDMNRLMFYAKTQKTYKNQWFFNDFANLTFPFFYPSWTKCNSIVTYLCSKSTPKAPQGSKCGSLEPSWDHLGTPFCFIGATLGALGAPFLLPWLVLEAFLVT